MSGRREPDSDDVDEPQRRDPDPRRLAPTSWATLAGWAVGGLLLGRLWRPVAERVAGTAPTISLLQGLVLFFVAAILGATAWLTWRALHVRRERLEPQQAVNRLVLARACALVGALVAGGYAGYAIAWLGSEAELADERIWRSVVAALGGVSTTITAVLLERACRVRPDDEAP